MLRSLKLISTIIIFAALFGPATATDTKMNTGPSRLQNSTLPPACGPLARPQNSFGKSGGELSTSHGFPNIEAFMTCPTSWLTGFNAGLEAFGGSLNKAKDIFGDNLIGAADFIKVQIIFETDPSKQSLCQTFRTDFNWDTDGVGIFPGSAWDVSDPLNPRRLNLCFAENGLGGNVNHIWDPTTDFQDQEFVQVMKSDYDSSGLTYAGVNAFDDAATLDMLYAWWPVVKAGHSFFESEPCTLTVTPYYLDNLIAVPNDTEIILDWRYIGGSALDSYLIYGDTVSPPTTLLAEVTFPTHRYVHTPVVEGETYYYRIEAHDVAQSIVATSKEKSSLAQTPYSSTTLVDFWNGRSNYGDCWGYTDTAGNEYALICARDEGVSIIDLSTIPISEVGFLPSIAARKDAKDIKIYKNYAIMISEFENTQIFDISDVTTPVQVSTIAHDGGSGAHNCMVDGDHLFVVGNHGVGGLEIFDLTDPAAPVEVGGLQPFYYHDLAIFNDTLACAGIYGDGVDLLDVSDRTAPFRIGGFNYAGSGPHNCEFSADGKTLFTGDEIGTAGTWTRAWDISDYNDFRLISEMIVDPTKVSHNCYRDGDLLYIAHYTEGLRVFDISNPADPTEVAWYDTYLESGSVYAGNWNVYPYLPSGKILLSDIESGLFVITVDSLPTSCCVGLTGNIDDDPLDIADIADLTFLIDNLFINFTPLVCPEEGNIDGDTLGVVDIADLTFLIDNLFINFPPTAACQ